MTKKETFKWRICEVHCICGDGDPDGAWVPGCTKEGNVLEFDFQNAF